MSHLACLVFSITCFQDTTVIRPAAPEIVHVAGEAVSRTYGIARGSYGYTVRLGSDTPPGELGPIILPSISQIDNSPDFPVVVGVPRVSTFPSTSNRASYKRSLDEYEPSRLRLISSHRTFPSRTQRPYCGTNSSMRFGTLGHNTQLTRRLSQSS